MRRTLALLVAAAALTLAPAAHTQPRPRAHLAAPVPKLNQQRDRAHWRVAELALDYAFDLSVQPPWDGYQRIDIDISVPPPDCHRRSTWTCAYEITLTSRGQFLTYQCGRIKLAHPARREPGDCPPGY